MLMKLLPIIFLIFGSAMGVGAGYFMRQPENAAPAKHTEKETEKQSEHTADKAHKTDKDEKAYVKLNNQFVVPVVKNKAVVALVVLSLSLEVPEYEKDGVFKREPKLRDSFLQVLFDHANMGGFDGAFTDANNLAVLRNALREVGQKDLGQDVLYDVLILDIARQDY